MREWSLRWEVLISKTFRAHALNDAWVNMSRNQTFNSTLILFPAALSMADTAAPWKSLLWVWNTGSEVRRSYSPGAFIEWKYVGLKSLVCSLWNVSFHLQVVASLCCYKNLKIFYWSLQGFIQSELHCSLLSLSYMSDYIKVKKIIEWLHRLISFKQIMQHSFMFRHSDFTVRIKKKHISHIWEFMSDKIPPLLIPMNKQCLLALIICFMYRVVTDMEDLFFQPSRFHVTHSNQTEGV